MRPESRHRLVQEAGGVGVREPIDLLAEAALHRLENAIEMLGELDQLEIQLIELRGIPLQWGNERRGIPPMGR